MALGNLLSVRTLWPDTAFCVRGTPGSTEGGESLRIGDVRHIEQTTKPRTKVPKASQFNDAARVIQSVHISRSKHRIESTLCSPDFIALFGLSIAPQRRPRGGDSSENRFRGGVVVGHNLSTNRRGRWCQ